jgi:hypothetical protein
MRLVPSYYVGRVLWRLTLWGLLGMLSFVASSLSSCYFILNAAVIESVCCHHALPAATLLLFTLLSCRCTPRTLLTSGCSNPLLLLIHCNTSQISLQVRTTRAGIMDYFQTS